MSTRLTAADKAYYRAKSQDPAWRPVCPQCTGKQQKRTEMISTFWGFECLCCGRQVNKSMEYINTNKKEDRKEAA